MAQHKWLVKLMGFNFYTEYKKGAESTVADALYRRMEINVIWSVCHDNDGVRETLECKCYYCTDSTMVRNHSRGS